MELWLIFDVCIRVSLKMVYQSSNTRAMSKSIQATSKQSQSHQLQQQQQQQEENNKRLLSTKSGASASSATAQHQSHHSRMANEYANVKSQCRRNSQSALQNQKPVHRSESSSGHQLMAMGAKCRNDHKIDGNNQDASGDNRHNNEHRQNGAPVTDIYADDDLAEVKNDANVINKNTNYHME